MSIKPIFTSVYNRYYNPPNIGNMKLPPEILVKIFTHLVLSDPNSCLNAALACKAFHRIINAFITNIWTRAAEHPEIQEFATQLGSLSIKSRIEIIKLTPSDLSEEQQTLTLSECIIKKIKICYDAAKNDFFDLIPDSTPEKLSTLTHLNFIQKKLTILPPEIKNLTDLTQFSIIFSPLKTLPESFGKLHSLTILHLNRNHLTILPESFGDLTSLTTLGLSYNQLEALPDSIGQLNVLRTLYLHHNRIETLPQSLGNLTALQDLHLASNQLTALPESFGGLHSLEVLYLNNNQIQALPRSFRNLTGLQLLDLDNNNNFCQIFDLTPFNDLSLKYLTALEKLFKKVEQSPLYQQSQVIREEQKLIKESKQISFIRSLLTWNWKGFFKS